MNIPSGITVKKVGHPVTLSGACELCGAEYEAGPLSEAVSRVIVHDSAATATTIAQSGANHWQLHCLNCNEPVKLLPQKIIATSTVAPHVE